MRSAPPLGVVESRGHPPSGGGGAGWAAAVAGLVAAGLATVGGGGAVVPEVLGGAVWAMTSTPSAGCSAQHSAATTMATLGARAFAIMGSSSWRVALRR